MSGAGDAGRVEYADVEFDFSARSPQNEGATFPSRSL